MSGLAVYEVAGTVQFHEGVDWCDAYRTVMESVVRDVRCLELFLERMGGYLKDRVVHYHYTVPLYSVRAFVEARNWERAQDFVRACLQSFCAEIPYGVGTQGITCSSAEWHGEPNEPVPEEPDYRCHCGAEFNGDDSVTRYIAHKRVHLPEGFFDGDHAGPPNPADFPGGRVPAEATKGCVWVAYTGFPPVGREVADVPRSPRDRWGVQRHKDVGDGLTVVAYRKDEVPANVQRVPVWTALDIIRMVCRREWDRQRNEWDHLVWLVCEWLWHGTGRMCIPDGEGTLFGSWEAA